MTGAVLLALSAKSIAAILTGAALFFLALAVIWMV